MYYYDAVVIGLGGVGSFALRSLVKQSRSSSNGRRPLRFLGIERFNLGGHSYGSSHGRTRIYRRAYFENENYVPWIEYSISEFRQLEIEHNISLMNECGLLTIAPTITDDDKSTIADDASELPPLLQSTKKSADMHNIPIEILSNSDIRQRYPQLQYKDNMIGAFEPTAGYLRPELILQTVQNDILGSSNDNNNADVTIMENTEVLDIIHPGGSTKTTGTDENDEEDNEYVSLNIQQQGEEEEEEQQQQEIKARCVLISAGAWSGHLLPPSWKQHLKVTRQIQSWIDVGNVYESSSTTNSHVMYDPSNLPCWFMETPDSSIPIYGAPYDPQTTNPKERSWVKVGCHGRNDPLLDPSTNPTDVSSTELSELQHAVRHSLTDWSDSNNNERNEVSFVETQPCMYTMTPDHHYIIGSPMRRTFCVAGLSGHGFKMTPALGRMMADYYYYFENALVQQQQQQQQHQQQQQGNDSNDDDDVMALLEKKWNFGFCSRDRFK